MPRGQGLGLVATGQDDSGAATVLKSSPNLATITHGQMVKDAMDLYKSRLSAMQKARAARKPFKLDLPDVGGILHQKISEEKQGQVEIIKNSSVWLASQEDLPRADQIKYEAMISMVKQKVGKEVKDYRAIMDEIKADEKTFLATPDDYDEKVFGERMEKIMQATSMEELQETFNEMGRGLLEFAPIDLTKFTKTAVSPMEPHTDGTATPLEGGGVKTDTTTEVPEENQIRAIGNTLRQGNNYNKRALKQAQDEFNKLPEEDQDEYHHDLATYLYYQYGEGMTEWKSTEKITGAGRFGKTVVIGGSADPQVAAELDIERNIPSTMGATSKGTPFETMSDSAVRFKLAKTMMSPGENVYNSKTGEILDTNGENIVFEGAEILLKPFWKQGTQGGDIDYKATPSTHIFHSIRYLKDIERGVKFKTELTGDISGKPVDKIFTQGKGNEGLIEWKLVVHGNATFGKEMEPVYVPLSKLSNSFVKDLTSEYELEERNNILNWLKNRAKELNLGLPDIEDKGEIKVGGINELPNLE